ncbi:MAG: hypothetical protein ACKVIH_08705 [Burkholderiales bacterium]
MNKGKNLVLMPKKHQFFQIFTLTQGFLPVQLLGGAGFQEIRAVFMAQTRRKPSKHVRVALYLFTLLFIAP